MTKQQLNRELSNRHVQLIAIGGAIGTGLFLGAGQTIVLTGPSILLTYIITFERTDTGFSKNLRATNS